MANPTNRFTANRRFRHLALAIVLSTGTVGGTMAFAMMTAPAFAQAGGGGGGSGGEGGGSNGEDEGGHGMGGGNQGSGGMMGRGGRNLDGERGLNEGERGKRGGRYGQGGPHPHPYPEDEKEIKGTPFEPCGGSRDTANTKKCRYTQPRENHRRAVSPQG